MNTEKLLNKIEELKHQFTTTRHPYNFPTMLYIDSIHYHKLLYFMEGMCFWKQEEGHHKVFYSGMRVFKVDVQEVHINVC